jgi:hypothetical protein
VYGTCPIGEVLAGDGGSEHGMESSRESVALRLQMSGPQSGDVPLSLMYPALSDRDFTHDFRHKLWNVCVKAATLDHELSQFSLSI